MRHARTAWVFDLDSTLADTRQRHHLLPRNNPGQPPDWERYAHDCIYDAPMGGTVALAQLGWRHHQIHICSSRSETARGGTMWWLATNNVPYEMLRLREDDEPTDGTLVVEYIRHLQEHGPQPVLAVNDWPPEAARITADTGVPCIVVNPVYRFVEGEGCLCQACQQGRQAALEIANSGSAGQP